MASKAPFFPLPLLEPQGLTLSGTAPMESAIVRLFAFPDRLCIVMERAEADGAA